MAAWLCKACNIRWPRLEDYKNCPMCDRSCMKLTLRDPQDDWEALLEDSRVLHVPRPTRETTRISNRLERFERAGLDFDRAAEFALSHVDLALFEKLAAEGCPLETAAQIVAPIDSLV